MFSTSSNDDKSKPSSDNKSDKATVEPVKKRTRVTKTKQIEATQQPVQETQKVIDLTEVLPEKKMRKSRVSKKI